MFTIILRQAGFRRTFTPIIVQSREFKREVVPSDLDVQHPDNPFNTINNENKNEEKEQEPPQLWVNNNFGLDIPDGTYLH